MFYGHPKLRKLEEVVLEHFRGCSSDGVAQSSDETGKRCPNIETRVMIFSQYRESVQEIADLLSSHAPLVRVMSFVGHGTTGKSTSKGLTQREQTEVCKRKSGSFFEDFANHSVCSNTQATTHNLNLFVYCTGGS